MRERITFLVALGICVSCSYQSRLEMPSIPNPPAEWPAFDSSSSLDSACPNLSGRYLEPPTIQRSGKQLTHLPSDHTDLYSNYIPFYLGDREELTNNEMEVSEEIFVIHQIDGSQFSFIYWNPVNGSVVRYVFLASEGDFECHSGYLEFPQVTMEGMIEGNSMNFQIRNILLKDQADSLIIQSTRGPSRGNTSISGNDFSHEFLRYPKAQESAID